MPVVINRNINRPTIEFSGNVQFRAGVATITVEQVRTLWARMRTMRVVDRVATHEE